MLFQMVQGPTHIEFTAGASGRLLKFSGARLARAEVNKNSDQITAAGIDELAATVAGTPIDDEHEELSICGIFTEGAGVDDPALGRVLEVGGLVHADRYPEVAAGIQDGTRSLSIEADGQMARCSVCNKTFASSDMYCEHLKNKFKSGAVRTVEGLTCLGGGVVRRPAGNGTDFTNAQIRFVAAHSEPDADDRGGPSDHDADDAPASGSVPEPKSPVEAIMKTCPHCGAKLTAAVEACPNPACAKPLTLVAMSDDLAAALANLTRLGQEDTAKLNTATAETATVQAQVVTLTASLEKSQADLTAAQALLAQAEAASRRARLGARLTDEQWTAKQATLLAMTKEQFDTMLELAPLAAPPAGREQAAGVRLDAEQETQSDDKTIKVVL